MNIFKGLYEKAFPYYPILGFKGSEIKDAIFESWGATTSYDSPFLFSNRFETIASIVKAKTLRYRFEKRSGERLKFEEIVTELCPDNTELAEEIATLLNKAVRIDKSIQDLRKRTKYNGKVGVNDNNIDEIVMGPIYYGALYDEFVSSAIDFQSDELNDIFMNEVLIDFEGPIYFGEGNETHKDVVDEDLDQLNKTHIYKSKTMDMLKLPNGGFHLCVDVNKRFKDGDCISTNSAWAFGQEYNRLGVIIIK